MKSINPPPHGSFRMTPHVLAKRLRPFIYLSLLLTLSLPCGQALALATDKDQPIQVEADGMEIDEQTGVTTYIGNVEMVQGSIRLKADKVRIFQNDTGTDRMEAEGKPAEFRQRPDNKNEDVKGYALLIKYSTNSELLYMIGDAVLLPGDGHKLASEHITYDRVNAVMKAGAAIPGVKKSRKSGRIKTTLAPRKKKAAAK